MSLPGTANRVSPEEEIQTVHSASGGGGGESNEAATRLAASKSGSVTFMPSNDTGLDPEGHASTSSLHGTESAKYRSAMRLNVKTKWDIGSDFRKQDTAVSGITIVDEATLADTKTNEGATSHRVGNEDEAVKLFLRPGIFHPYSLGRLSWDMWIALLLVYTALIVPYSIAFQDAVCDQEVEVGAQVLSWMVDVCFWIDIILNFRTAIIDPAATNQSFADLITDWQAIAKAYIRGWFILDVAGSIPVQLFELILDQSGNGGGCSLSSLKALRLNKLARLAKLLKLLRLVRLARWNRIVNKAKDSLSINPGYIRLFQGLLIVFVIAHVLACLVYGMVEWQQLAGIKVSWASYVTITIPGDAEYVLGCPFPDDDALDFTTTMDRNVQGLDSKMAQMHLRGKEVVVVMCRLDESSPYLPEAPAQVKYLVSLYLAFTTITTVGYGDITMVTTTELVYAIVMMSLGATTFAVMVGQMAALLSKLDIRATAFKERMEDLDDFMHQENLPLDLRFRTRAFFEYGFFNSRDIPASVHELSASLRTEVALHLYNDLITTVPFFRDCGKEFLTEVILKLKAQTLSPGDYLYEAGEFGDSMYFLIKGSVEVEVDGQNGVYAELKEGAYVGETCVLGIADTRPVTVRAINWCNLFCLTMDALEDCLTRHPEAQVHFMQLAVSATAEKAVQGAIEKLGELRREEEEAALGTPTPTNKGTPKQTSALMSQIGSSLESTPSDAMHGSAMPKGSMDDTVQQGDRGAFGNSLKRGSLRNGTVSSSEMVVEPPVVRRALQRTKKIQTSYNTARALLKGETSERGGVDGVDEVSSVAANRSAEFAANALRDYLSQVSKSKSKLAAKKAQLHIGIEGLETRVESMIKQCTVLKGMLEKEL